MYFTFFSKKDNQKEAIELTLTPTGWLMTHECYQGVVEPNGQPYLQRCIEENYTEVPSALGDAFQEIWEAATLNHISQAEIQERLDTFSEWVSTYNIHRQLKPIYSIKK
jgi:hypothetical protein